MNSYFPNPFLSPLQGDGQTGNSLSCSFAGLAGRYETAGSAYGMCTGQQQQQQQQQHQQQQPPHQHHAAQQQQQQQQQLGHYGSSSPGQLTSTTDGPTSGSCDARSGLAVNGYAGAEHHQIQINSAAAGWTLSGSQPGPGDYVGPTPGCVSDASLTPTSGHSGFSSGTQPIPFYPWMGVVGQ